MNYSYLLSTGARFNYVMLLLLLCGLLFHSCEVESKTWDKKSDQLVASEYIETHPEFSEFAKLIERTGLRPLMSVRGPYTLLLPNNDAMQAYYKEKGVSSLEDFDNAFLKKLAFNHLLSVDIATNDMGLGALRDTNAIGDFLVTEFQGSDIILNRNSRIIDRDIRLANGYAHVIDHVIDPMTKDVYAVLSENPSFKIFAQGLKIAGLDDTLKQVTFPYGRRLSRTRFTILAVPDSIYNQQGITCVDDLIRWTGAKPDSLQSLNNAFYRYMEYHCMAGTYYLNTLSTGLYPILSADNNVSVNIDTDYKINLNSKTKMYTSFIVKDSNTPAKMAPSM